MLSFFPLGVLDEVFDLTESVSEGRVSYLLLMLPEHLDIRASQ